MHVASFKMVNAPHPIKVMMYIVHVHIYMYMYMYLYQHFSSDGHTEDDMCIMPIEKVEDLGSRSAATSKRLEREDYWCRELCTYYPYGLNDNIRGVGNISKMKNELVVNTLFIKNKRKLRIRKNRRQRKKRDLGALTDCIEQYLENYKTCSFCFNVRTLVLSLPKKCMYMVWNIFQNWVATHEVPTRIRVLFRDLIAFRKNASHGIALDVGVSRKGREHSGFLKVHYHNKGIEMIGLPQILNSRYVRSAIPPFLNNKEPPMVSYSYTRTISGRIFNQKSVVEELDLTRGTEGMCCDCSNSSYCYEPAGHVMTGDLTIIWDAKLRSLVRKGPSYREQNYIDWNINERLCREAVAKYKHRWSTREGVDVSAFNEWECKLNECIRRKIASLRKKCINKRTKHVLKSRKHLESLKSLHEKYVLVPADKAANNVIVVCKKYYLEVVMREITATTTYEPVVRDKTEVISEHLRYMTAHTLPVYFIPYTNINIIYKVFHI